MLSSPSSHPPSFTSATDALVTSTCGLQTHETLADTLRLHNNTLRPGGQHVAQSSAVVGSRVPRWKSQPPRMESIFEIGFVRKVLQHARLTESLRTQAFLSNNLFFADKSLNNRCHRRGCTLKCRAIFMIPVPQHRLRYSKTPNPARSATLTSYPLRLLDRTVSRETLAP